MNGFGYHYESKHYNTMKKQLSLLTCTIISLFFAFNAYAQTISGKVTDKKGIPLEFVTVATYALPDSTLINGCLTNKQGEFKTTAIEDTANTFLKVSFIGFETQYITVVSSTLNIILKPEAETLGEVQVIGKRPTYTVKDGSLVAQVKGTELEKLQSFYDVMEQLPFVNIEDEKINIFGKGEPLVFIDGRQVRDENDLRQVLAQNIKNIQVITSPGSQYGADVQSVIKITTAQDSKDKFSGQVFAKEGYSNGLSGTETLNLNYRNKRLDVFGSISANHNNQKIPVSAEQKIDIIGITHNTASLEVNKPRVIMPTLGVNYINNKKQTMGIRYSYFGGRNNGSVDSKISNTPSEWLLVQNAFSMKVRRHQTNAYFNGNIGNDWELNFNSDFLSGYEHIEQLVFQNNLSPEHIMSNNKQNNFLLAGKGILSKKLAAGAFSAGAEYSFTKILQSYNNKQSEELEIPNTNNQLLQNRTALFADYQLPIKENYQLKFGLRAENIDFDYYDNKVLNEEQSKNYLKLLPNISLSNQNTSYNWSIAYEQKMNFPTYAQLSNNIQYNDPFNYQTGNPNLLPETINSLSGIFGWKNVIFSCNYNVINDDMESILRQYNNQDIVLKSEINNNTRKELYCSASYDLIIGIWKPSFEVDISKQWLTIDESAESFNTPRLFAYFYNTFNLKKNWTLFANAGYSSKGEEETVRFTEDSWFVNLKVSKSFFDENLKLLFQANNILDSKVMRYRSDINNISMLIDRDAFRSFSLAITYNFNTKSSRYKGESSSEELNRL